MQFDPQAVEAKPAVEKDAGARAAEEGENGSSAPAMDAAPAEAADGAQPVSKPPSAAEVIILPLDAALTCHPQRYATDMSSKT